MQLATEEKKTKLQEELSGVSDWARGWKDLFKAGYYSNPPPAFVMVTIGKIVNSRDTVWFMAGLSVEAIGITVQMFMHIDSYPIMDAIVAALIAAGLYFYQKGRDAKCLKP